MDARAALAAAGFDIVHAFDASVAAREPGLEQLAGSERLGFLIGNTRALWPAFQAALAADPGLAADSDPLDRYTERTIDAACSGRIYYGHRRYDGAYLPLQRLAAATGLGAIAPTRLVVHPTYGPWFALRAIAVVEGDPPPRAPITQPCRCDAGCSERLHRAEQSMDADDWLAVRTGCALQTWRYSDEQIAYHYAHLRRLMTPPAARNEDNDDLG